MRAVGRQQLHNHSRRSPLAVLAVATIVVVAVAGVLFVYWQHADEAQKRQITALRQALAAAPALPTEPATPGPAAAAPGDMAQLTELAKKTEPPVAPVPDAPPLPGLDEADASVRDELATLGWGAQAAALLASDQLLRRFVVWMTNLAAGKIDHKSGPLQPLRSGFAVTTGMPVIQSANSEARYKPYVATVTALDVARCAQGYRRYYPLLSQAWAELGEPGSFHAVMLKALQHLLVTPQLSVTPQLVKGEKGVYLYADPALEALSPAQKQLLRTGHQNHASLRAWLQQFQAAIAAVPAA